MKKRWLKLFSFIIVLFVFLNCFLGFPDNKPVSAGEEHRVWAYRTSFDDADFSKDYYNESSDGWLNITDFGVNGGVRYHNSSEVESGKYININGTNPNVSDTIFNYNTSWWMIGFQSSFKFNYISVDSAYRTVLEFRNASNGIVINWYFEYKVSTFEIGYILAGDVYTPLITNTTHNSSNMCNSWIDFGWKMMDDGVVEFYAVLENESGSAVETDGYYNSVANDTIVNLTYTFVGNQDFDVDWDYMGITISDTYYTDAYFNEDGSLKSLGSRYYTNKRFFPCTATSMTTPFPMVISNTPLGSEIQTRNGYLFGGNVIPANKKIKSLHILLGVGDSSIQGDLDFMQMRVDQSAGVKYCGFPNAVTRIYCPTRPLLIDAVYELAWHDINFNTTGGFTYVKIWNEVVDSSFISVCFDPQYTVYDGGGSHYTLWTEIHSGGGTHSRWKHLDSQPMYYIAYEDISDGSDDDDSQDVCGDGVCGPSEDENSCPQDCITQPDDNTYSNVWSSQIKYKWHDRFLFNWVGTGSNPAKLELYSINNSKVVGSWDIAGGSGQMMPSVLTRYPEGDYRLRIYQIGKAVQKESSKFVIHPYTPGGSYYLNVEFNPLLSAQSQVYYWSAPDDVQVSIKIYDATHTLSLVDNISKTGDAHIRNFTHHYKWGDGDLVHVELWNETANPNKAMNSSDFRVAKENHLYVYNSEGKIDDVFNVDERIFIRGYIDYVDISNLYISVNWGDNGNYISIDDNDFDKSFLLEDAHLGEMRISLVYLNGSTGYKNEYDWSVRIINVYPVGGDPVTDAEAETEGLTVVMGVCFCVGIGILVAIAINHPSGFFGGIIVGALVLSQPMLGKYQMLDAGLSTLIIVGMILLIIIIWMLDL